MGIAEVRKKWVGGTKTSDSNPLENYEPFLKETFTTEENSRGICILRRRDFREFKHGGSRRLLRL